jgi:diadenosine tetraphosphate (Ap4A) HIT family hydrolase
MSNSTNPQLRVVKGVTYNGNDESTVVDCIFCRIQQRREPATVVLEDEEFIVFKTIDPVTKLHLLVTPRQHIRNLKSLQSIEDASLVKKMKEVGERAVLSVDSQAIDLKPIQFCFHVPPYNSIDHLHMHAIAYPHQMTYIGMIKYNAYLPFCEVADNTIKRLLRALK